MIISVTSLKGGVGKSTIAQNISVNFAHMKYKVLLIDTDTNGSSVRRSGLRTAGLPAVQVIGLPDAEALKKNLPWLSADYEIVIIDGTPQLSKIVGTMLLMSDITIVPLKPGAFDLRAVQTFQQHFEQASLLKETKAYLLINMYDKTNLWMEAWEAMQDLGFPVLNAKLGNRVAFAEAVTEWKGVHELKKDPKAKAELAKLTKEILTLF